MVNVDLSDLDLGNPEDVDKLHNMRDTITSQGMKHIDIDSFVKSLDLDMKHALRQAFTINGNNNEAAKEDVVNLLGVCPSDNTLFNQFKEQFLAATLEVVNDNHGSSSTARMLGRLQPTPGGSNPSASKTNLTNDGRESENVENYESAADDRHQIPDGDELASALAETGHFNQPSSITPFSTAPRPE